MDSRSIRERYGAHLLRLVAEPAGGHGCAERKQMSAAAALQAMLEELEANRLVVVLAPQRVYTNCGGMIRVAAQRNAEWYRELCAAHGSNRVRRNAAWDTRVKRQAVLRVLRRLVRGQASRSWYVPELERCPRRYAARSVAPSVARRAYTMRWWGSAVFGGAA